MLDHREEMTPLNASTGQLDQTLSVPHSREGSSQGSKTQEYSTMRADDRMMSRSGSEGRSSRLFTSDDPVLSKPLVLTKHVQALLGCSYIGVMLVLGVIVIGMEVNLVEFGNNIGVTTEKISTALISRAVGSIVGSFCSGKILMMHTPHWVILETVILDAVLLLSVPFLTSEIMFQILFFMFGLSIPVSEAAVQFLTCKVHGVQAGPWLQANNIAMWFATMVVPMVHYALGLKHQYFLLSGFTVLVAIALVWVPNPTRTLSSSGGRGGSNVNPSSSASGSEEEAGEGGEGGPGGGRKVPVQPSELLIAGMLFWVFGTVVQSTTYLDKYVEATGVVPLDRVDMVLTVFLLSALLGQGTALWHQSAMTTQQLYGNLAFLLLTGSAAMAVVLAAPGSALVFWVFMGVFGFCIGPASGYCYDLWNRTCEVSEMGAAVVVFGAYSGSGLFSFLTYLVWQALSMPQWLMAVNLLGCAVPLVLMLGVKCLNREEEEEEEERRKGGGSFYADDGLEG